MHIGQAEAEKAGKSQLHLCDCVFIPKGITRDERRGYVMRQERNEMKYVKI